VVGPENHACLGGGALSSIPGLKVNFAWTADGKEGPGRRERVRKPLWDLELEEKSSQALSSVSQSNPIPLNAHANPES
jgi:hypothetical protein